MSFQSPSMTLAVVWDLRLVWEKTGPGGACANSEFFDRLAERWDCRLQMRLPRFLGVTDTLSHYVRARPAGRSG